MKQMTRFDLLIFEEVIIALKLEVEEEWTRPTMFSASKMVQQKKSRRYFGEFRLSNIDTITTHTMDNKTYIWAKKFSNMQLVEEESFVISLETRPAHETEKELRHIWEESKREVHGGDLHKDHKGIKYQAKGSLSDYQVRCGECNQLLHGLLAVGTKCEDCDKIFHTHCFSKYENEYPYKGETLEYLIKKKNALEMQDLYSEGANYEAIKERLKIRSPGTFALVPFGDRKALMRTDNDDKIQVHEIKTLKVEGEDLFYIQKGTCDATIMGLLNKHRKSHHLFVPINCESDDDSDSDESEDLSDDEVPRQERHKAFFWGDITTAEVAEKLKDQEPGTFLLRKNGDRLKLSWKNFDFKLRHSQIRETEGGYSLTSYRTFPTLQDLTSYYQTQTDGRYALGSPLKILPIKGEQAEARNDPSSYIHFQGTIESNEAERILLKEEITYDILWEDQDKGLWWSFQKGDVVKHIEIKRTGSAFTVKDTQISFTETSIEEAVKHLKRAHDVENLRDQKSGTTKEEENVFLQPQPDKKKLSYDDSGTSSMHPNEPFKLQAFHGTMSALNA